MADHTLSPSGLKYNDYGDSNWAANQSANFSLLNSTLLKLSALGDVDSSGLQDGDALTYNSASGKWERRALPGGYTILTTTTTTTTTV